ncbi:MAG: L,D-transpeptidase [Polyangiales bacterium]
MQRTRRNSIGSSFVLAGMMSVTVLAGCELPGPIDEKVAAFLESPRDLGPPRRIFAKRFVAPVHTEPHASARRLGYLRAGALLESTTTLPLGTDGCAGGWYELATGGFVCAGRDVTVFSGDRLPERRAAQPDLGVPMPYDFATVRARTPLYRRLPAEAERVHVVAMEEPAGGAPAELEQDLGPLVVRVLEPGFYVSLDRTFERDGHTYWRTQQNGFVAEAQLRRKEWSDFHGQALGGGGWELPIAVTRAGDTQVFRLNARAKLRSTRASVPPRTWLPIKGRRHIEGATYLVVGEDRLVREADVRVIAPRAPPEEVGEGERWIDIDLERQSLVAYVWRSPRYVTLVSTGRLKTPRPDLDYRTPRGLFRIRAKHLTATMDNDEPGEPPYSLEDVPYVMYFKGAYAFHSAFWHDQFGRPRSHGCVNLAPIDAKWLYEWAGPDTPQGWHGAYVSDDNPGTWVLTHGETPGPGRPR